MVLGDLQRVQFDILSEAIKDEECGGTTLLEKIAVERRGTACISS